MCGIAGRFRVDGLLPAPGWHARADALLAHRGPDGAGYFVDARCELVHRRLALLDLSATGAQPMPSVDHGLQLVFNGEIYNHRELRRELLARGHRFRGSSDTEVILHGYETFGARIVTRLQGIFAIALYDARRRRLLLARDRFGVKPLFHAGPSIDGEWLFASEMKAILAREGFAPRIDRQACFDFLGLGFVPATMTGFANIMSLDPGMMLTLDESGVRLSSYVSTVPRPDPARRLDDAVDEVEAGMLAAVQRQSVADVPVGALLSGGIDSSLVVAARRRLDTGPIDTFSVGFRDAAHDESAAARAVAVHCETRHHALHAAAFAPTADDVLALLRHFDQPFADVSSLPTFWVTRAIRSHGIICALSGDGGDEAFGGYPRFWQAPRILALMDAPSWVRTAGAAAGRALGAVTRDQGRRLTKAVALAVASHGDSSVLLAGFSNYLSEPEKEALLVPDARAGLLPNHRLFDGWDPAAAADVEELSRRMTDATFRLTLPGDMLRKVDMMSMRNGVEVRVPMLDDDLVALGLSLPHRLKTDGRRGKLVLRALARRWLPGAIAHLPKRGFSVPLDVLASPGLQTALEDHLTGASSRTRHLVAPALVRAWLARFAAVRGTARAGGDGISRGGLAQRLITLLSLEVWMRDHALTW